MSPKPLNTAERRGASWADESTPGRPDPDGSLSRRDALVRMTALPLVLHLELTADEMDRARTATERVRRSGQPYEPRFFTDHEWSTIRLLVDLILPRDERSGSATDAGVPEFMDFVITEGEDDARRVAMRGGLAWLDTECRRRFVSSFLDCAERERAAVLDDIAWPARARPEMSHGVRFFSMVRDLTASGFWSSRMGVEDLQYMGNTAIPEWNGCPTEQLEHLGLEP